MIDVRIPAELLKARAAFAAAVATNNEKAAAELSASAHKPRRSREACHSALRISGSLQDLSRSRQCLESDRLEPKRPLRTRK